MPLDCQIACFTNYLPSLGRVNLVKHLQISSQIFKPIIKLLQAQSLFAASG